MYLYPFFDFRTLALMPWNSWAKLSCLALQNPFLPRTSDWIQQATHQAFLLECNTRYHGKPSYGIRKVFFRGEPISVTETVIKKATFGKLIHFQRSASNGEVNAHIEQDPKILIIAPLFGHFSTLLRGTIEAMLPSHDVYVTDWTDAKMVPLAQGFFDLEDQIGLLMEWIDELGPHLHVIAAGQSSVGALCATALLAAQKDKHQPSTLTLLGGPIDTQNTACVLCERAQLHPLSWFRETYIQTIPPYHPAFGRRVYPGIMHFMGASLPTLDKSLMESTQPYRALTRGDEETGASRTSFYEEYMAVMDVPEEFFIQFIERVYQRRDLACGTFTWRGVKVDPAAITQTALLTIESDLDDVSPPGQTRAALALCNNLPAAMKQSHLEIDVGHYGLFNGRKWRNNIQPIVHKFIRTHSNPAI